LPGVQPAAIERMLGPAGLRRNRAYIRVSHVRLCMGMNMVIMAVRAQENRMYDNKEVP